MRRILWVLGILFALALGYLFYAEYAPRAVPAGQPPLTSLNSGNFDELRQLFNASSDRVRVLTMLSPT